MVRLTKYRRDYSVSQEAENNASGTSGSHSAPASQRNSSRPASTYSNESNASHPSAGPSGGSHPTSYNTFPAQNDLNAANVVRNPALSLTPSPSGRPSPRHSPSASVSASTSTVNTIGASSRASSTAAIMPTKAKSPSAGDGLSWQTKFGYACGNFYYELSCTLWFSYTLLFFQIRFGSALSGALMLFGQVVSAMFTPLIGFGADYNRTSWFGVRKHWYLIGTIGLTVSTPFLYSPCIGCENASATIQCAYFAVIIVVLKFGTAACQVAHVSLITDLAQEASHRVTLNAYRQISSILSSVSVYLLMFIMLDMDGSKKEFTKDDLYTITSASYLCCLVGIYTSTAFYLLVHEPKMRDTLESERRTNSLLQMSQMFVAAAAPYCPNIGGREIMMLSDGTAHFLCPIAFTGIGKGGIGDGALSRQGKKSHNELRWKDWLMKPTFWKVAFIYMFIRLFLTLTQVYMPLYLKLSLQMPNDSIAILPFITYVAGFLFSLIAKVVASRIGIKFILFSGTAVGLLACSWIFFGGMHVPGFVTWQIYIVGALFGIRGTLICIASIAICADLIGSNKTSGAFVFSTMYFLDKVINGAFIALIQGFNPSASDGSDPDNQQMRYYRLVMSLVTGSAGVMILIGLLTIARTNFSKYAQRA